MEHVCLNLTKEIFDMAGKIICCVISFGCAILFYSIGVYAQKSEKPMWFWSGTEVNTSQVTDIPKYNRENAIMWKLDASELSSTP